MLEHLVASAALVDLTVIVRLVPVAMPPVVRAAATGSAPLGKTRSGSVALLADRRARARRRRLDLGSTVRMPYIPRGTPMRHLPDVELRHSFEMTKEARAYPE